MTTAGRRGALALQVGALTAAMLVLATMAPASAQGVTGTDRGMAAPGRFIVTPEIGIVGIQFSRLNYGQQRAGGAGTAIVRDLTDNRPREGGFASAIAAGWGLPGGLLGNPAEVYGRFGFVAANSSITETAPSPAPGRYIVPLVAPAGPGSTNPGTGALLSVPAAGTLAVSADRRIRSYDGGAGVRMNIRVGGVTVTPGIELAYQRLDQDDDIAFVATTNFRTAASLHSNSTSSTSRSGLPIRSRPACSCSASSAARWTSSTRATTAKARSSAPTLSSARQRRTTAARW